MAALVLDCRNLNCPMPIVNLAKAVRGLAPGDEIIVEATDPSFEADVAAWTRRTGNALLSFVRDDAGVLRATVRKA